MGTIFIVNSAWRKRSIRTLAGLITAIFLIYDQYVILEKSSFPDRLSIRIIELGYMLPVREFFSLDSFTVSG
jgi:hypothetical protein